MTADWGSVLRAIGSRGWADEDADVVAELLTRAHKMADLVLADYTAKPELCAAAQDFLDQLHSDTFGQY